MNITTVVCDKCAQIMDTAKRTEILLIDFQGMRKSVDLCADCFSQVFEFLPAVMKS